MQLLLSSALIVVNRLRKFLRVSLLFRIRQVYFSVDRCNKKRDRIYVSQYIEGIQEVKSGKEWCRLSRSGHHHTVAYAE